MDRSVDFNNLIDNSIAALGQFSESFSPEVVCAMFDVVY